MLLEFFKSFGRITTYDFVEINIITPNYVYYKNFLLKLSYEYYMMLIMQKNISKTR
jgi:hypothetical protein